MDRSWTCITGAERTTRQLARRLQGAGELHEIRLDLLESIDAETFALVEKHGPRVIATCRPGREGGGFVGDETARLSHLREAAEAGAGWVDIELDVFEAGEAIALTRGMACRTIASAHDFAGGVQDAATLLARLDGCGADVAKLAVTVDRLEHLVTLKRLRSDGQPRLVIGMGTLGTWTRLRPSDFGSLWTYVVEDLGASTAPGQVTVEGATRLRVPGHDHLCPVAVIDRDSGICTAVAEVCCDVATKLDEPLQFIPLPAWGADDLDTLLESLGATDALDVPAMGQDAGQLRAAIQAMMGRPLPEEPDIARQIGWI